MRKIITAALLSMTLVGAANASTNSCGMVIGFNPGGAADRVARLFQKYNPDFQIHYRPGAEGALAVRFIAENPEISYLANPVVDDTPIELHKILNAPQNIVLAGKTELTLDKLLTGKANIGYSTKTTPQFMLVQQFAKSNPNLNLIPTGSDVKTLPLLINGDLDGYIGNIISAGPWLEQYKGRITNILTIDFNKPFVKGNARVESLGFTGLFVHKDAPEAKKQHAINCLEKALSQPGLAAELKEWNANPVMIGGKEKDALLKRYIDLKRNLGND
jgi:hypothetical protein